MSRLSFGGYVIAVLWLCTGCSFKEQKNCESDAQCKPGRCELGFCVPIEPAATGGRGGRRAPTSPSETPGEEGGSGAQTGTTTNPAMMTPGGGTGGTKPTTPSTTGGSNAGTDAGMTMKPPVMMGECKAGDAPRSCPIATGCGGTQRGVGTMWGDCEAPADRVNKAEACNGTDDNCNGMVDEQVMQPCYPAGMAGCTLNAEKKYDCKGPCLAGTQTCMNGVFGSCENAKTPAPMDICQPAGTPAMDEDCTGAADEMCECTGPKECYTGTGRPGVGVCKSGQQLCTNNHYEMVCTGEVRATLESCNGMDDDCNGTIDDVSGIGLSCSVPGAKGECIAGTSMCVAGSVTPKCVATNTTAPSAETCNGKDDDCNGMTDDVPGLQTNASMCGGCGKPACTAAASSCCAGGCVDLQTDTKNCGMCGKPCGANETCAAGLCKPPVVMGGAGASGSSGGAGASGSSGMSGGGASD